MQEAQIRTIVAIPCFNTGRSIGDIVAVARRHVDQVIVVNDGSRDNTAEAARAAGAMVVSHEHNMGKAAAMRTAVQNTDADIVVFIDGDGQHEAEDIPRLVEPILQGQAGLVIGSRCLPRSKVVISPLRRRLSNSLASFVISVVISFLMPLSIRLGRLRHFRRSRVKADGTSKSMNREVSTTDYRLLTGRLKWITDCTSGFRAVRREAWQKLNLTSQGFQIETEMIYEAARNNIAIAEVPISCNWDSQFSGLSISRDGVRTLGLLGKKLLANLRGGEGDIP